MQMIEAHALVGSLETGLDSGLGDTCGRLAGAWSGIYCLAFEDSISCSAAEVGTGSAEHLEAGSVSPLFFLNAETLTGSERDQLHDTPKKPSNETARVHDGGPGGGNPSVGGLSRH